MTAIVCNAGSFRSNKKVNVLLGYCDSCGKVMVLTPEYAKLFWANPGGKLPLEKLHHCNSCADYFQFDYDKDWKKK